MAITHKTDDIVYCTAVRGVMFAQTFFQGRWVPRTVALPMLAVGSIGGCCIDLDGLEIIFVEYFCGCFDTCNPLPLDFW